MPSYLQKRVNRWYAVLEIPKPLRPHFGNKARFVQSLETENRQTADRRKLPIVAAWKGRIELANRKLTADAKSNLGSASSRPVASGAAEIPIEEDAAYWRRQLARARDGEERAVIQDQIEFAAWEIGAVNVDRIGEAPSQNPTAKHFHALATGRIVPFAEYLDEWLDTVRATEKTKDMHRAAVQRFSTRFKTVQDVSRPEVRRWVTKLLNADGLAIASVQRILSPLRGYWRYLQSIEVADDEHEPFTKLDVSRRTQHGDLRTARLPFTPKEVLALLAAAEGGKDGDLADLIRLAMWTGCRIEELCALKAEDVHDGHFTVVDAKTNAGWRDVPIHSELAPTLARLLDASQDGYVLSGLTTNKYGDRSNAIGKRFGRLKSDLGFGRQQVFHSIRKTVVTILENAGVPENVVADIVGHEKTTMTYGLYSGGVPLKVKRKALEKISYPHDWRRSSFTGSRNSLGRS